MTKIAPSPDKICHSTEELPLTRLQNCVNQLIRDGVLPQGVDSFGFYVDVHCGKVKGKLKVTYGVMV